MLEALRCGFVDRSNAMEHLAGLLDAVHTCRVDLDGKTPEHCCLKLILQCLVSIHAGLVQPLFLLLTCFRH